MAAGNVGRIWAPRRRRAAHQGRGRPSLTASSCCAASPDQRQGGNRSQWEVGEHSGGRQQGLTMQGEHSLALPSPAWLETCRLSWLAD
jgi:hypothetical protein